MRPHVAWACGLGMWLGHVAWACGLGMWLGHLAWAFGLGMWLRHVGFNVAWVLLVLLMPSRAPCSAGSDRPCPCPCRCCPADILMVLPPATYEGALAFRCEGRSYA